MTKEEFTNRLYQHFSGFLKNADRSAQLEIDGMAEILDPAQLLEWVKEQRNKALAVPALRGYNLVTRHSMGTPAAAAKSIVSIINHAQKGNVDWEAEFNMAAHILSNYMTEAAENWRYKETVNLYMDGAYADARARAFAKFVSEASAQQTPTDTKQGPPAPLTFEKLFVSPEAMERALFAAISIEPPLISVNQRWTKGYAKLPGLRAFFTFCLNRGFLDGSATELKTIDTFSHRFLGVGVGPNALNQAVSDDVVYRKLTRFDIDRNGA